MSLFIAIKQNKLDRVINLLIREDINGQNGNGYTPLNWAIKWNRTSIISYLLDQNINVNIPNNHGWSPLHQTIYQRLPVLTHQLLKAGANVNVCNDGGYSPLYYAMITEQYDIMMALLDQGMIFETEIVSTLYEAVCKHNITAIDLLLKYRIYVDHIHPYNGQTVLHQAVKTKNMGLIDELLLRGANPNIQDRYGNIPLHLGISLEGIVDKLISSDLYITDGRNNTLLHLAVSTGNLSIIKKLLAQNINIHHVNNIDEPCICNTNNPEIVELLCKYGADLNIKINNGKSTPFHKLWTMTDVEQLVPLYLKYGAHPSVQNHSGQTVLHLASYNGQTNIVRQLLQAGVDYELRDHKNKTAKDVAISRKKTDIVELIQQYEDIPDIKEPSDY